MMDTSGELKIEYNHSFDEFIKKINAPDKKPYDRAQLTQKVRKAKNGWDLYLKNECEAEALVYEKDSMGYITTYHECLSVKLRDRISYYRNNQY
ncbi:hypothetical protein ABW286_18115 [Erwinia papayae]|uniref:Lysozyme inhibitor LprI N-terminal domain-containing protein n=1 Tax=Erwinia papayae TaxID=206499 RepID=A0ABV3N5G9_9GAMM